MTQTQHSSDYLPLIADIQAQLHKKIIGQEILIRDILIGLLSGGHVLLEGVPGVAKTLTIETLAKTIATPFQRIQFTPDLLPSDLIGTEIYNIKTGDFDTKKWPIFTNILLADEINRAPSKVQSALLEAMAEKQITLGDTSFPLQEPFLVLATQNPVEQSWTYPLPEAQLDRFMLKSSVTYPSKQQEQDMLTRLGDIESSKTQAVIQASEILEIQAYIKTIQVSQNIISYISDIVDVTRQNNSLLRYGVSPRGSISLLKASKVIAFLEGRDFVIPEDVQAVAQGVLAHRLILSYEALAQEVTADNIIQKILSSVHI